jgi:hypothetical protein
MNTRELMKVIGQQAVLTGRTEFVVVVRIVDAKMSYGRVLYQVTPLQGEGSIWVAANRVTLSQESEVQS